MNIFLEPMLHLIILTKVSGTEAEKNYAQGTILSLRAFFYYMLVNQYGLPYNYDKRIIGSSSKN